MGTFAAWDYLALCGQNVPLVEHIPSATCVRAPVPQAGQDAAVAPPTPCSRRGPPDEAPAKLCSWPRVLTTTRYEPRAAQEQGVPGPPFPPETWSVEPVSDREWFDLVSGGEDRVPSLPGEQ